MVNTLIVNLTDMTDQELKDLKGNAERRIRKNFSFRARREILYEEFRRIIANEKKRVKEEGILASLKWFLGRIKERVRRRVLAVRL